MRRVVKGSSVAIEQSLRQFQEAFADEKSCAAYLFKMRWPDGFVCPRCGDGRAWPLNSRPHTYQCRGCGRQTSIKAGTVMQGARLPLTVWFWAAHVIAINPNPVPVRHLQKLLSVSYKAAWKLRRTLQPFKGVEALETLDDVEGLEGLVEVNRTELPSRGYDPVTRRSELRKVVVAVALELAPLEDNTLFPHGRIRLATIQDSSAASIEAFVRTNVTRGATLLTDGHKSYVSWRHGCKWGCRKGVQMVVQG
jgi:transposase-like protein